MKRFTPGKVIRRTVRIASSDRAIAAALWVLEIGEGGVKFHRLHQVERYGLSWRSIISHALIHNQRVKNGVKA